MKSRPSIEVYVGTVLTKLGYVESGISNIWNKGKKYILRLDKFGPDGSWEGTRYSLCPTKHFVSWRTSRFITWDMANDQSDYALVLRKRVKVAQAICRKLPSRFFKSRTLHIQF